MDKKSCLRCQGLGHIASEKRVVSLAEYQTFFEELEEERRGRKGAFLE